MLFLLKSFVSYSNQQASKQKLDAFEYIKIKSLMWTLKMLTWNGSAFSTLRGLFYSFSTRLYLSFESCHLGSKDPSTYKYSTFKDQPK